MDWMRYRKLYFLISLFLIASGVFSLYLWGLRLGVDFTGGTVAVFRLEEISTEEASDKLKSAGIQVSSIQKTNDSEYIFRLPPLTTDQKSLLTKTLQEINPQAKVEELRFESVGPSIGPELVRKTFYAIIIASLGILTWVALQFKSFKFGVSAVLAMLHDTFNLVGLFSLLGHFFAAEVDFLFVTALLTTLSFSVHDTIVVYDRIRESQSRFGGSIYDLANKAVTETMVRSLNNSFTIIFMIVALILLGGSTIKWFATALLLGTVLGTYSSPFVAVPILVTWDEISKKFIRK